MTIFDEISPECPATAAWLEQAAAQDQPRLVARCNAFYAKACADDALMGWIGGLIGACKPYPAPVRLPAQIETDFKRLHTLVCDYY